jgi:hypothetical protein
LRDRENVWVIEKRTERLKGWLIDGVVCRREGAVLVSLIVTENN